MRLTVRIHDEGPQHDLWAEVDELPGFYATGDSEAELRRLIAEACWEEWLVDAGMQA